MTECMHAAGCYVNESELALLAAVQEKQGAAVTFFYKHLNSKLYLPTIQQQLMRRTPCHRYQRGAKY
jgi:hypothetical protein